MALDVQLIRDSFAKVVPQAQEFVDLFYQTLFSDYPAAQGLFETVEMAKQKSSLVGSLAYIVEHVDQPESLVPYMKKMGKRHVSYGAQPEHYEWVGYSLIKTLEAMLGDDWNSALEENWVAAYQFLAETAISGAEEEEVMEAKENKSRKVENEIAVAVRELARTILVSAIDSCVDDCNDLARQKSSLILKKAIEEEAEEVMSEFQASAA